MFFNCPNIVAHNNKAAVILGHLKMINVPFGTNEIFNILDVPELQHITIIANTNFDTYDVLLIFISA